MSKQLAKREPVEIVRHRMNTMLASFGEDESAARRFKQASVSLAMSPGIASCEPTSVLKALYTCARLALIPDPAQEHVAVVPFKDNQSKQRLATVIVMYKGLVELAKRACPDLSIRAGTVCANDDYVLEEGLQQQFRITKRWWEKGLKGPGDPIFSYCISQQGVHAAPQLVVVSAEEGRRIGAASKAGMKEGRPWHDHFQAMCEKTAVRRSSRFWQLSPDKPAESRRLQEAIRYDERSDERGDPYDLIGDELFEAEPTPFDARAEQQAAASTAKKPAPAAAQKQTDQNGEDDGEDVDVLLRQLRDWVAAAAAGPGGAPPTDEAIDHYLLNLTALDTMEEIRGAGVPQLRAWIKQVKKQEAMKHEQR